MPIEQVARMSFMPIGLPSALGMGLQGIGAFSSTLASFPSGCHICEVEIDPETARRPLIDTGAGQALLEEVGYETK
jgi:carbon-monoxide dehydrogenase large subunit